MDLLLFLISVYLIYINKKLEWVLLIILCLATNFFSLKYFFLGTYLIPNMYDGGLILTILLYFRLLKRKKQNYYNNGFNKLVIFFCLYLCLTVLFDLIINGISILAIIKTSRHWLFLLIFFITPKLDLNVLHRFLKLAIIVTFIFSFIICFESLSGIRYFTLKYYAYRQTDIATQIRGVIPSSIALFSYFLMLPNNNYFSKSKRIIFSTIFVVSILLSAIRSLALAVLVGTLIFIFIKSKDKISSFFKIGLVSIITVSVVSNFVPVLGDRFDELFTEIDESKHMAAGRCAIQRVWPFGLLEYLTQTGTDFKGLFEKLRF